MIVRDLDAISGTEQDVIGAGWNSRRLLLRSDSMGFSLSDTIIFAGAGQTYAWRRVSR